MVPPSSLGRGRSNAPRGGRGGGGRDRGGNSHHHHHQAAGWQGGGASRGGRGRGSRGGNRTPLGASRGSFPAAGGNRWSDNMGGNVTQPSPPVAAAATDDTTHLSTLCGDFFADMHGAAHRDRKPAALVAAEAATIDRAYLKPLPMPTDLPKLASSTATSAAAAGKQLQQKVLWLELGLCKALVRAVTQLGYIAPTPVQAQAIPYAIQGSDICARAVTGSGKTGAFLLPVLHRLLTTTPPRATQRQYIRALVLVPSRELGVQCAAAAQTFLQFATPGQLNVGCVIGGLGPSAQEAILDNSPQLVVATPGRMCDVVRNYRGTGVGGVLGGTGVDLSGVEILVLDEVDKMLSTTILEQVRDIISRCPMEEHRQTMMFSATMTKEVDEFAKELIQKPHNIDVGHVALAAQLKQQFVRISSDTSSSAADGEAGEEHLVKTKTRFLVALCRHAFNSSVLVFCKYRTTTHRLHLIFQQLGFQSGELHSNQSQEDRTAAVEKFSSGKIDILFGTDVASRGLDIRRCSTVVNFDLPISLTAYIHRVGRTARIGQPGTAVSLVHEKEDAAIMRSILALSSNESSMQGASVKQRVISDDLLTEAAGDIAKVFPVVKATLAAEAVEEKLKLAEKKLGSGAVGAAEAFAKSFVAKPQRTWVLSKREREARDQKAKEEFLAEAKANVEEVTQELAHLNDQESRRLKRQKMERRKEADRAEAKKERELADVREKKKRKMKQQLTVRGSIKRQKQVKLKSAKKEQRAADREKKGKKPFIHSGKKSKTKSRHAGRMKRH